MSEFCGFVAGHGERLLPDIAWCANTRTNFKFTVCMCPMSEYAGVFVCERDGDGSGGAGLLMDDCLWLCVTNDCERERKRNTRIVR